MTESDQKIIRETLVRLLARREHSQQELVHKLSAKDFSTAGIYAELQRLQEKGLQSDSRFAESQVRTRIMQGHGPNRIKGELREHQIQDADIQAAINQAEPDWFAMALEVYEKKYANKPIKDWQDKQKRMRFLQYRGFTLEQINCALEGR